MRFLAWWAGATAAVYGSAWLGYLFQRDFIRGLVERGIPLALEHRIALGFGEFQSWAIAAALGLGLWTAFYASGRSR